ncbi:hypothetical protein OROGR_002393 [Orobanche gracilis]
MDSSLAPDLELLRNSPPDLKILHRYLLSKDVDFRFSFQMHEKLGVMHKSYEEVVEVIQDFFVDLKEVFEGPKFHKEYDILRRRYLVAVAVFHEFLGLLLQDKTHLPSCGVDGVLKELKFFITIFSVTPLQAMEDDKVRCLLEQFEGIVNRAGRFVHSLIFSPNILVRKMNELLKANIIEFLETLPSLTTSEISMDSFFIIESLMDTLRDLLNGIHGSIVRIKDGISKLHQGLTLSWSLLKDHVEIEEFKEIDVQIGHMAYGAEYLICSFLVGDVPIWALKLAKIVNEHPLVQDMRDTEVQSIRVGFEEDEKSILEQLLYGEKSLQIISILGPPGLGKTTLAKRVYNHSVIDNRFDIRLWYVVSQTYNREDVLDEILRNLGGSFQNDSALQIYQSLMGRRYLIILDDVWDSHVLDDLRRCFPDAGNHSRILFTSRDRDVAPEGSIINTLPFLSDDLCWKLFEKKVFNGKIALLPELQEIGKKITIMCKGLPLLVVVIAGILSSIPMELSTWKNIEENLDSYIFSDPDKSVMQILNLSYKHLSQQLRPCFLYFGMFKEDQEISVKELQQLWIAEGFIQKEEERSKESVAEEYFMQLVNKSLVIVTINRASGGAKACAMHDLLREMCLRIAEEDNFLKHVDERFSDDWKDIKNVRRLRSNLSYIKKLPKVVEWQIRSLISPDGSLSFFKMKLLRALECSTLDVSDRCESLVNLRYLRLSYVNGVPKSITSFVNLEYLIVDNSWRVSSQIFNMLKLRYLKAYPLYLHDDCDISHTNKLVFLSCFWLTSDKKYETYLRSLIHLRRLSCLIKLEVPQCFNISFLMHLQSVSVKSIGTSFTIKFPSAIKKITLEGRCMSWEEISIVGALPNLEVLKLQDGAFVGDRWDTKDDEFKKLRFLKLDRLDLKKWNVSSREHFPMLQKLLVHGCKYLDRIPMEIGEIATLQLIEVRDCQVSVEESATEIEQEQHDFGNEGLTVRVSNRHW